MASDSTSELSVGAAVRLSKLIDAEDEGDVGGVSITSIGHREDPGDAAEGVLGQDMSRNSSSESSWSNSIPTLELSAGSASSRSSSDWGE